MTLTVPTAAWSNPYGWDRPDRAACVHAADHAFPMDINAAKGNPGASFSEIGQSWWADLILECEEVERTLELPITL